MFVQINKCRVCSNNKLDTVLDLGDQYLSGIFPKTIDHNLQKGPLKLVKCNEENGGCGHVQLEHTFDLPTMYGINYGYRSGLNGSMVNHLKQKYENISNFVDLNENDIVVDIGGNDGTFLGFFPTNLNLVSIDPTSEKFSKYFSNNVSYIPKFFSESVFREFYGNAKAKIVTSFSMFYDLEDPCQFASEVNSVLDPEDGIWILEQSYMPQMLKMNSFDTICHEHLSYYGMRQLKYIMDQSNLKIIQFEFNDVNGGSISLMVSNKNSKYEECTKLLNKLISREISLGLKTSKPWKEFEKRISKCKDQFWELIDKLKKDNLRVAALGASTKGNIILQGWNITPDDILMVGDINEDKDGSYTPGTWIPIRSEDYVLENYDAFVILPWHFKKFFLSNKKFENKILIFPLPTLEVVNYE